MVSPYRCSSSVKRKTDINTNLSRCGAKTSLAANLKGVQRDLITSQSLTGEVIQKCNSHRAHEKATMCTPQQPETCPHGALTQPDDALHTRCLSSKEFGCIAPLMSSFNWLYLGLWRSFPRGSEAQRRTSQEVPKPRSVSRPKTEAAQSAVLRCCGSCVGFALKTAA